MVSPVYKTVNLTNLLLNPSNPRFSPVEHQTEAIASMIADQQEKLLVLAKHIARHGLNPSDLIIVEPHKKQWVVREGNRRVTALKLINQPLLIPPEYPKLRRDFQVLNKNTPADLLRTIPCVVLDDENEINEWVRLKHTGQNEGSGTVNWDGQQTSRFRSNVQGKPDMRLTFLDSLKQVECVPSDIRDRLDQIKITNFDRLVKDPHVRELLGLEKSDEAISLKDGVNPFLVMALRDLVDDAVSVGHIYHKKDRQKYMELLQLRKDEQASAGNNEQICDVNIKQEFNDSDAGKDQDATNGSPLPKPIQSQGLPLPTRKQSSYPIKRKALVPSSHKLTITHARLLKIFNELKSLPVDEYPNAVAVLFRVFIELSTDCYITKNLSRDSSISVDKVLSAKVTAVADHLEANKIMTKHELRAARQMSSGDRQTQSIRTFHAYVHNKDVTPSVDDLKSAWDDTWLFIEKIWG